MNLRLFDDPAFQYDLLQTGSMRPEEETRRRIANMKDDKIRRILDLAPPCPVGDAEGFRSWWARWMPLAAGRQLWPDGNHRTAMMMAELVAEAAGFTLILEAADMDEMRRESKAIVQARWARPPPVTEQELVNPGHPLCRYYAGFQHRLQIARLPPA